MTRDAAYRRVVAIDRIADLMRSHACQSDLPAAYRDACAAYLARAGEYSDALQAPAVRRIVDAIATAEYAIREAALSLSTLLAPPDRAEAIGHLRERLYDAAEVAESVSGALTEWPEFWLNLGDYDDDPDPEGPEPAYDDDPYGDE